MKFRSKALSGNRGPALARAAEDGDWASVMLMVFAPWLDDEEEKNARRRPRRRALDEALEIQGFRLARGPAFQRRPK